MAVLVSGGWGLGDGADSNDRKKPGLLYTHLRLYNAYTTLRTVYIVCSL
jgi:hypothetical protein